MLLLKPILDLKKKSFLNNSAITLLNKLLILKFYIKLNKVYIKICTIYIYNQFNLRIFIKIYSAYQLDKNKYTYLDNSKLNFNYAFFYSFKNNINLSFMLANFFKLTFIKKMLLA